MQYAQSVAADSLTGTVTAMVEHKCVVVGTNVQNGTAAAAFVQLFDAAAIGDVTIGTTVAKLVVANAASSSANETYGVDGIVFELGVMAASTTLPVNTTGALQNVHIAVL